MIHTLNTIQFATGNRLPTVPFISWHLLRFPVTHFLISHHHLPSFSLSFYLHLFPPPSPPPSPPHSFFIITPTNYFSSPFSCLYCLIPLVLDFNWVLRHELDIVILHQSQSLFNSIINIII